MKAILVVIVAIIIAGFAFLGNVAYCDKHVADMRDGERCGVLVLRRGPQ